MFCIFSILSYASNQYDIPSHLVEEEENKPVTNIFIHKLPMATTLGESFNMQTVTHITHQARPSLLKPYTPSYRYDRSSGRMVTQLVTVFHNEKY